MATSPTGKLIPMNETDPHVATPAPEPIPSDAAPATAAPAQPAAPAKPGKAPKAKKSPKAKKPPKPIRQVIFHTYPKLIFAWPIILIGFLLWPVVGHGGFTPEVCGWIFLGVITLTLLTLGIDLERDHAVFWAVVFLAFFFLGKWMDARFDQFTLLGDLYRWLADLDVAYSPSLGIALSFMLLPPYLVMMIYARLQHRWRITHNEFEHYSWGRADDSLARGAKRVRSTYPDLLELLLCGAGTLVVYSATGRTELRRIPHVPMIFRVRKRINLLLESTAVTHQHHDDVLADELDDEGEGDSHRAQSPDAPGQRNGNEPL